MLFLHAVQRYQLESQQGQGIISILLNFDWLQIPGNSTDMGVKHQNNKNVVTYRARAHSLDIAHPSCCPAMKERRMTAALR